MVSAVIGNLTKRLRKEYIADYSDIAVKDLFAEAVDSNHPPVCIYYSVKDIPNELLNYLYIMGNRNRNDLFESCWRAQCKRYSNLSTFKDVHELVCMRVLDECKEILCSLERKTMTLENVDKYFRKFQETDLENNLTKLCQGIRRCFPDIELLPAKQWVPSVVVHIQEYKRINNYMNAATIVLKLKESMKLIGDFTVIDTLAQQVVCIVNLSVIELY